MGRRRKTLADHTGLNSCECPMCMREFRKERIRNWVEGQIAKACDTCEKNDGKRDICIDGFIKSLVECEGKNYRKRF